MREEIEARFAMDAVDIYGLSEVMGPGVANECIETKDGLVVWEDHFFPEVVDPATGAPLPDGRRGELVFTSLTKEALPVIRYRTRDLTELLPGTARTMRRMGRITGRTDDMLIIRGVNVFPNQIEELVLREPALSPHYVLEVRREGRLDQLDVIVEPRDASVAQETAGEAVLRVGQRIKDLVGVTARIRLASPGTVARSMGKAKRVIDLRQ
jgi:phenylacetate-CoA ligase